MLQIRVPLPPKTAAQSWFPTHREEGLVEARMVLTRAGTFEAQKYIIGGHMELEGLWVGRQLGDVHIEFR